MELNEGQKRAVQEAIKRINNHEICTCIAGPAGTGKAQPVSTKIPTPTGKMRMGDLRVGDFVFNEKGQPTKVIGVFPQGVKEIYEVSLQDGRRTQCCEEHLWYVKQIGCKDWKVFTTKEILDSNLYLIAAYRIPVCNNPVEYNYPDEIEIDYFLAGQQLAIQEEKIPESYKYISIPNRHKLIQGLMSWGGMIDSESYDVRFSTKNGALAADVQEVLYSLGYISSLSIDLSYHLNIDIPNKKKYKLFEKGSEQYLLALEAMKIKQLRDFDSTAIVNIQPTGRYEEMVCIKVDNPLELYLTNDFIVTHNTTVVRYIIDELGLRSNEVAFATFTGKAAQVLQKKGNRNAMTLHKLLYDWKYDKELREFYRIKKNELKPEGSEEEYKLIVVDEVSMAPKDLMDELFSHRIPVICLGDDAQLPPVSEDSNNHILDAPNVRLTEIMRQEAESEIIQIATKVRLGGKLTPFKGKEVQIINRSELTKGMMKWADQILCAKNETRTELNYMMRDIYGKTGKPQIGDKIICLRNYWETFSNEGNNLINGTIGTIKEYSPEWVHLYTRGKRYPPFLCYNSLIETDSNEILKDIRLDIDNIETGKPRFNMADRMRLLHSKSRKLMPFDFTYAYAITVWKAQGSEWDKVLLFEENFPYDREEKQKFIYTGITRAAKKLIVVLNK